MVCSVPAMLARYYIGEAKVIYCNWLSGMPATRLHLDNVLLCVLACVCVLIVRCVVVVSSRSFAYSLFQESRA